MEMLLFFQCLLCVLFLFSAITKMFSLSSFNKTVQEIGIHKNWSMQLSILLVVFEILISFLILFDKTKTYTSFSICGLMLVFATISIRTINIKSEVKCSCFGSLSEEKLGIKTLVRILIITLLRGPTNILT